MVDYFPLSTALGSAFCNRKLEIDHLMRNIKMVRPTLIMSPRRYGKTSLALNVFGITKILYSHIDFYKEFNEEDIERSIMNGIGKLLGQIESKPKQLLRLAGDFFSDMHVKVVLNKLNLTVEINERKRRPADNIQTALERLHELSFKKKKKVVIFMDEFQKLAEISLNSSNYAIEAAIRSVAQLSKNVAYIFSGSNRHLIQGMFFDKNRPFYKLCDSILLDRISENDYIKYIQNAAMKHWKKPLSDEVLRAIFDFTEYLPYYVNLLCSRLWLQRSIPNKKTVFMCWEKCAIENRSQIEKEIDLLSFNQRKLLISLARFNLTDKPTGRDFLKHVCMSSTSISQALSALIEKDYVYRNSDGYYKLIDPLFNYVLS